MIVELMGLRSRAKLLGTFLMLLHRITECSQSASEMPAVSDNKPSVSVFHFVMDNWGDILKGSDMNCIDTSCNWYQGDQLRKLVPQYQSVMTNGKINSTMTTLAVYNVHTLFSRHFSAFPRNCDWRTDLTMAQSEEAHTRYHLLFGSTFRNFDGFSTLSPYSTVQRIHGAAFLREADLMPQHNFSYLIKAGSYGAFLFKKFNILFFASEFVVCPSRRLLETYKEIMMISKLRHDVMHFLNSHSREQLP